MGLLTKGFQVLPDEINSPRLTPDIEKSSNGNFSLESSSSNDINQNYDKDGNGSGIKTTARAGLIEFGLPIILNIVLKNHLDMVWVAVISSIPVLLSMLYSIFVRKMFTPFSLIMIASIYVDLAFNLLFMNPRIQEMSNVAINTAISLTAFITIPFNNSFLYYLAKPISTDGDRQKELEFDAKWRLEPIKRVCTQISIGLGIGFLLVAGLGALLSCYLPINNIYIANSLVSIGGSILIGACAILYKKQKTASIMKNYHSQTPQIVISSEK